MGSFLFRIVSILILIFAPMTTHALTLSQRLKGRIVLQTEKNGEAWYIRPSIGTRVFLGKPSDAFAVMRQLGIGISDMNIRRIPLADVNLSGGSDSDGDGLSDAVEQSYGINALARDTDSDGYDDRTEVLGGYDPFNGNGAMMPIDEIFAKKNVGKIFLQSERNGEAWYINPVDNKRYYLGRPADAFAVMRGVGLGVSNQDIASIAIDPMHPSTAYEMPQSTPESAKNVVVITPPQLLQAPSFPPPTPVANINTNNSTSKPSGYENYVLKKDEMLESVYDAAAQPLLHVEEPTHNTQQIVSASTFETVDKDKFRIDVTGTTGNIGSHTMVLDWGTSIPSLTWVTYGKTINGDREYKDAEYDRGHVVLLKDLEPDTLYYYAVRTQDSSGRQGQVYRWAQKTLPQGGKEVTIETAFFIFSRLPEKYKSITSGSSNSSSSGSVNVSIDTSAIGPALWKQFNKSSEIFLDGMVIEPEDLESMTITAKPTEIFVEWKAPPPITKVAISSPTAMSQISSGQRDPHNVRILFGEDMAYGLEMYTGISVGKDPRVPGTNEVGNGFMRFRGLNPGKTYHIHFRASTELISGATREIGMRDIAVTTPLSGEGVVTTMKDFSLPSLVSLAYPKNTQFPFISFSTAAPSYAVLEYEKASLLRYDAPTYHDVPMSISNSLQTKHTMRLANLEKNTLYTFTLTVSDAKTDVVNVPYNTTGSTASPLGAYRRYSFNLMIE